MANTLSFDKLVENVGNIHNITSGAAKSAVNQLLTIRNWAIGYYIVEFEQNGADRAEYGSHVLSNLAEKLAIKGLDRTQLNLCRIFYQKYPQICATASHRLQSIGGLKVIPDVMPGNSFQGQKETKTEISAMTSHKFETDPDMLISRLSFSHIREIMKIDDPFERLFYEFECMKEMR